MCGINLRKIESFRTWSWVEKGKRRGCWPQEQTCSPQKRSWLDASKSYCTWDLRTKAWQTSTRSMYPTIQDNHSLIFFFRSLCTMKNDVNLTCTTASRKWQWNYITSTSKRGNGYQFPHKHKAVCFSFLSFVFVAWWACRWACHRTTDSNSEVTCQSCHWKRQRCSFL